jgi:hypothetical protein
MQQGRVVGCVEIDQVVLDVVGIEPGQCRAP